jgi:ketosteroid isomerase-like protein
VASGDPRREIEAWITAYRDAFQTKNTARLVQLGAYTPGAAEKLSRILAGRENLQVSIQGPQIQIRGDNEAVVTLKRVDTYEDGGREVSQTADVTKTLRREQGVWRAQ